MASATTAIAVVIARRNGAAPRAVALVGLVAIVPLSFLLATVRTQVFGALAFAVVLGLLVRDARAPSKRVWLVLVVLALWTNLHGSVLLGVGVVVLRGITIAFSRPRRVGRGLALGAGAVAAALASPYIAHLPHYYRHTAFNPLFAKFVAEWRPATPSAKTALFYVLIAVAVRAFARRRAEVTAFEWLVLLATGVAGIAAVRNAGFFALAALMIIPAAFATGASERTSAAGATVIAVPVALLAVLAVAAAARMHDWIPEAYPAAPAQAVERIARAEPGVLVFADVRFADWLLWRDPWLAGRVAFDARYELLSGDQIRAIHRFNQHRDRGWERAVAGYRVVVLSEGADGPLARALLSRTGARLAYGDSDTTVIALPA
jgi:hypothetical protein